MVGNPAPGVEIELVPAGDKHEVRVRGSNVTPGYYREPDLTREAGFDKGYINQRAALARRAAHVEALYAGAPAAIVV